MVRKQGAAAEAEAPAPPEAEEDWRPKPPPPAPPPKKKSPLAPFLRVAPYALLVAIAFFLAIALQTGLFGDALASLQESHRGAVDRLARSGDEAPPGPALPTYGAAPAGVAVGAPRTDARGRLTLITDQPAKVFLDGKDRGLSPLTELELEAGEHLVRLVHPTAKGRSRELVIDVPEGATLRIEEKAP